MKLRTSLCNPTALKKDITRFAPVWVLYSVGLFLLMSILFTCEGEYYRASNLADSLMLLTEVNFGYGFLNALLLFGDLFQARNCNALHAMPLRRECWYSTHVLAGLLFSLVPNVVFCAVLMPMLGSGVPVVGYWLAGMTLQYLFFFGLGVFSALCVGNRFAMVLVYGILNFFAMIVYWFYTTLYQPLLQGVQTDGLVFMPFCPIVQMFRHQEMVKLIGTDGSYYTRQVLNVVPGDGWGYLGICAVLGVVLLGLSLVLYRRRKLESAGDFMAVKMLEPVFLVVYTLCMAAFFQIIGWLVGELEYLFLMLGLPVGFFTGRMLLMRTTRVFQPKSFLWFVVFLVAFGASLLITSLDPLGITRRIPATETVAQVKIANHNPVYSPNPYFTDPADIDAVREMHRLILAGDGEVEGQVDDARRANIYILYDMADGTTLQRHYEIAVKSKAGQMFGELTGRPEFVLGTTDVDQIAANVNYLYYTFEPLKMDGQLNDPIHFTNQDREAVRLLLEAIVADAREGHMNQHWGFRDQDVESIGWLDLGYVGADGVHRYLNLTIYSDAAHTIAYFQQNPLPGVEYHD